MCDKLHIGYVVCIEYVETRSYAMKCFRKRKMLYPSVTFCLCVMLFFNMLNCENSHATAYITLHFVSPCGT